MEKKEILIVDDEETSREVVIDMITLFLTNKVIVMDAPDVESAQNIIKKCNVSLIISGIDMSGKDGIIFFKEVREMSKIPFIFMSGNNVSCQKAKKWGNVFEKPLYFEDFFETVNDLLAIH